MTEISEALLELAVMRGITHEDLIAAGVDEATVEGERVASIADIAARRVLSLSDQETTWFLWAGFVDDARADSLSS